MERIRTMTIKMWGARHKILRYIFSGGTAFAVNFVFLYVFTDLLHIYYLVSVVLAFIIALVVSFLMQKFWTFQDMNKEGMHRQAVVYSTVAVINTVINTLMVFVFVEYIGLHYLAAQFVSSALIAFESFFVYQIFVFKKVPPTDLPPAN